jgi:hypothetical protein
VPPFGLLNKSPGTSERIRITGSSVLLRDQKLAKSGKDELFPPNNTVCIFPVNLVHHVPTYPTDAIDGPARIVASISRGLVIECGV